MGVGSLDGKTGHDTGVLSFPVKPLGVPPFLLDTPQERALSSRHTAFLVVGGPASKPP